MVGKHGYDFQLILRLNSNLKSLCDALFQKRVEKNDLFDEGAGGVQLSQTLNLPDGSVNFVSAGPEMRLTSNSRIYVVGHGNPESTHIGIHNGVGYSVDSAATMIKSFIPDGVQVKRVVLICCYAGGNRFGEKLEDGQVVGGGTVVEYRDSFARALYLKVHDKVASVTARNARTSVGETVVGKGHHTMTRDMSGAWTHKDPGSKVMFHGMQKDGAFSVRRTYG